MACKLSIYGKPMPHFCVARRRYVLWRETIRRLSAMLSIDDMDNLIMATKPIVWQKYLKETRSSSTYNIRN